MNAIIVNGTEKEIAALALRVQGRRNGIAHPVEIPAQVFAKAVYEATRDKPQGD